MLGIGALRLGERRTQSVTRATHPNPGRNGTDAERMRGLPGGQLVDRDQFEDLAVLFGQSVHREEGLAESRSGINAFLDPRVVIGVEKSPTRHVLLGV